ANVIDAAGNNTATVDLQRTNGVANVTIDVTDPDGKYVYTPGAPIKFQIVVRNSSNSADAHGLILEDLLNDTLFPFDSPPSRLYDAPQFDVAHVAWTISYKNNPSAGANGTGPNNPAAPPKLALPLDLPAREPATTPRA